MTLWVDSVTATPDQRTSGQSFDSGTLVIYGESAPARSGCVARRLRPSTRRDHKGAMTPLVVATSLAMEGLKRDFGGCGGPQPLAGKQVARLLLRDRDLNVCFSHDHIFVNLIPQLQGNRTVAKACD